VTEYATLDGFYLADARRPFSGEADFGVHWHDGGRDWPRWRVSYIQATGEVYAVRQYGSPLGPVRVLGVIRPDPVLPGPGRNGLYYRTLDAILDGWADPEVSGFDLAWVSAQLARRGGR
jgi:hypothetical protein